MINKNIDPNFFQTIDYSYESTLEKLKYARQGSHYSIIYPDLRVLRKIYSQHIRRQIEVKNEIVLILSHYEATDMVRYVLKLIAGLDVKEYETHESLLILDSVSAFFGSSIDMRSFVESLTNYADRIGKDGVSVLADMGSFFHYNKLDYLIEYETSLPRRYNIKANGICMYHKNDFNYGLSHVQKRKLLEHHGRELTVAAPPH
jgi:hypothetical protein